MCVGGGGAPEDQSKVRGAFAQKRLRTTGVWQWTATVMKRPRKETGSVVVLESGTRTRVRDSDSSPGLGLESDS